MAWDGVIKRRIQYIDPRADGCFLRLECGHEVALPAGLRPSKVLEHFGREYPCEECSAPTVERIKAYRESVSFDDVIEKLRKLKS